MSIYENENVDRAYDAAETLIDNVFQYPEYEQEAGELAQALFEALDRGAKRQELLDIVEDYDTESWMPRGLYASWIRQIMLVGTGIL